MALPKKGIRKISIGGIKYYWTVRTDYQMLCRVVGIGLVSTPNTHVTFMVHYEDQWLNIDRKIENEINSIKPNLIREAVLFANSNERVIWNGKSESVFYYNAGSFSLKSFI